MATVQAMPARGDRNAPQFDSKKPQELRRYFTDLEYLFTRAAVTDSTEKKQHATRFLGVDDQEIWETLPSFGDAAKTYATFKAEVLKLYAGNDEDRRFSLSDLDALVGHFSRVGILSKDDLTSFYRQFLRITTYLVSKDRLSASEQSRSFLRAMQPATLLVAVQQRLQIKRPDNHPEDPYALPDLYDAAQFVIAGPIGSTLLTALPASAILTSPPPAEVKADPGIAALVGTVTDLIKVLATQHASNNSGTGTSQTTRKPRPDGCGYCSELDHFINQCQHVLTDIQAGRVVLPSGAFVPRTITGKDLRSRIEEWHRQNPGQLAAAQLLVEVAVDHLSTPSTSSATTTTRTFTLSDEDRMEALTREFNTLLTRAQAKRALASNSHREEPDRTIPPSIAPPAAPSAPIVPAAATTAPAAPPQHPFAGARDAAYAPPKDRNFGVPAQKPAAMLKKFSTRR
ncbi:hypothetical protein DFH09DRAFT_1093944 [Mycena vulgaris]|nr:hypothetical protein DFH09DRAFT_1093944 [Mycena vulgaris]